MVLAELGGKLKQALQNLSSNSDRVISNEFVDEILKEISIALLSSDVNVKIIQKLRTDIKQKILLKESHSNATRKKIVHQAIVNSLIELIDPQVKPFTPSKSKFSTILMVGLQGSGKTTTCTKLAYYWQKRNFRVGLVCTDTFRAGAFDQLKQNATRTGIPYYGSHTQSDPVILAKEGVEKFKREGFNLVIVDTSGRHKQESELFKEMKEIDAVVKSSCVCFVLDGNIGQACEAQIQSFKEVVNVGGIVVTKMDGHAKGGGAITAVASANAPIMFIGTGEQVQDLDPFNAPSFIRKMLGMGDISQILDVVQHSGGKDMMKKLTAGIFTVRDMRQQMEMISGIGISKFAGMLPGFALFNLGMSPEMLGTLGASGGETKMKRFMHAFDSMKESELDSDGKIFHIETWRMQRLAKGSGLKMWEIQELLSQYGVMEKMVKTMGGSKGLMKNMADGKKKNNPKQQMKMQNQLRNMIPPGLMEQMGGMQGMQEMMKQMGGGNGQMPDMSQLSNLMGGIDMSQMASMMQGMGLGSPSTSINRKPRRK